MQRSTAHWIRRGTRAFGVFFTCLTIYITRDLGEYNLLTPIHLQLADMGAFPHSEICALNRVGEATAVSQRRFIANTPGYHDASNSNPTQTSLEAFGSPASVAMIPLLQDRVSAPRDK
eukprot:TRINITY_DN15490_c0_g1_i1.p1 TRINITY_DN15490_c0_g1~~TRINITY_DN15490_c0_g1_i1.p1  ORF type:complete len:118 (+),score=5.75 TRINITY_DN15490_c0_g1_i1:189-542(+)